MKRMVAIAVILLLLLTSCGEQGMEGWDPSDIKLDAKYEEDANIALYPTQAAIFVSAEERVELMLPLTTRTRDTCSPLIAKAYHD